MDDDNFQLHPQLLADSVAVGNFQLSQCRLLNDSRFLWVLLIPQRPGTLQWHQLSPADYALSCQELRWVAEQVESSSKVERLNFGALGNLVPQLHLHLVGRYAGDAAWPGPVWGAGAAIPYADQALQDQRDWLRRGLPQLSF